MMTKKNKQPVHRKMGIFVGVTTTLFSICGPILQTVAIAEETKPLGINRVPGLPDVTSVINYDSEFSSNLDSSSDFETSASSSDIPEESTSGSSEETGTSETSSSSSSNSSTSESSNTSSSSSSTNSSSTDNSHNISSSSSSDKGTSSTSSSTDGKGETKPSSDKKDESDAKEIKAPIKYTKNQSTAEFIEEIGEDARAIGQKNDLYASVMIAQAILESGSGNSGLASAPNYNLFGIKGSYKGESVQMPTLEDNGSGSMYTITAKFRKYPSYKESLEDYATLMTGGTLGRSTFYQGAWKSNTDNYEEATKYLTGRYATDTRYNEKLNGLIETYDLTQYDQAKASKSKMKKSKETEKFIKEIAPDSKKIAKENDLYASVMIAEAILQSTSGNNVLAESHNIFLTEGNYEEKSVELDTIKHTSEGPKLEKVDYKEYPSYEIAMEDYVSEMKKDKETFKEMTMSEKDTYKKVTAYMTAQKNQDRKYHKKMNALIDTYDLTKYDEVKKEVKDKDKETTVAIKDNKKKDQNVDLINKLGQTMTDKLFEGLEKPTKYQVTQK
ncbi:glucosaminidase domain-containing protein [Vagococcus fluvialis]|uniref:glucosaminidase domain-containing protein n=1 Tax=Vagococcus fluvialis TaxID=2738 RepID=UPI003B591D84